MATPQTSFTVRFNRIAAWAILIVGVLDSALVLLMLALGRPFPVALLVAPLLILFGVQRLNKEYFTYTSQADTESIVVVEAFGKRRPYTTHGGGRFLYKGGRIILVEQSGKHRKLRLWRHLSHRSDWDAFIAAFRQRHEMA